MQITHDEVRNLIHRASDETLSVDQKANLDSHLASCAECRNYAASIQKMESILQPLLRKQWTQQPIPLSVDILLSRQSYKIPNSILLATRIAAVGVMFVMFMISAWQFVLPKPNINSSMSASVQPIPIPSTSTQLVSTETQSETCKEITYIVQGNDTLASIANTLSTSKQQIITANNLKSETVIKGMNLIIPVCNFTPTGIVNTSTITFTPILRTITSTPGG